MQAEDAGASGPGGREGAGSSGGRPVGDASRVARTPHAPGPGGDATPAVTGPGSPVHRLEAEIACGSLAPDAEPHREAIEKQLTVAGSALAVQWTAGDPRLLRISILNFLDQLSLVVRTMQRFGPPVSR